VLPTIALQPKQKLWLSVAIIACLIWASYSGKLLKPWLSADWIVQIPYGYSALVSLIDIAILSAAVYLCAGRISHAGIVSWNKNLPRWSFAVLLPAIIAAFLLAPFNSDATVSQWMWLVFGSPICEEIFYRGLVLGTLVLWCGWSKPLAYLLPAVFFGLAHASQGANWQDALGIVLITAFGSLLFGWVMLRWQSLWPAIILHVGMNGIWTAFAFGDNALGGWAGNAVRVGIVILAVVLTLRWAPSAESKP
jgi:uncharacterized protein